MYRHLRVKASAEKKSAGLVICLPDTANDSSTSPRQLLAGYAALDKQLNGLLTQTINRPEFSAAKGAVAVAYPAKHFARLYVLGLGKASADLGEALRVSASRLLKMAFGAKITSLEFALMSGLDKHADPQLAGRALADGLAIANFTFDDFKGLASKTDKPLDLDITADKPLLPHLARGLSVGESVNIARELAATPPNVANPAYLVSYCRKMANKVGLKCSIIDHHRAAQLGMGGLLAVGAAGSTPPAMIILEHRPRGSKGNAKNNPRTKAAAQPVLLVGKAVTFDTGGYSIKPAANLDAMKYDKCGGMAVIGAMHAIATLKLDVPVIGIIPTAENMVSDKAYRPGDIIRFCNGVTSEITNTDAEGRLILSDALAYGTRTYKPQAVIDLATLTGGVIVALGSHMAGMFCADDTLRDRLTAAGRFAGERLWPLPLWEEHRQQMKGIHGDLINSANREASPIQGAAFLSFFIEPDGRTALPTLPWAHLDIAGVADVKSERAPFATGPTGFGVKLLVNALENWNRGR